MVLYPFSFVFELIGFFFPILHDEQLKFKYFTSFELLYKGLFFF